MPELTRLERTKSMMRYLPPNGTAGLARSRVRGCSRVPCPPAITSASVLIWAKGLESSFRSQPRRNWPAKYSVSRFHRKSVRPAPSVPLFSFEESLHCKSRRNFRVAAGVNQKRRLRHGGFSLILLNFASCRQLYPEAHHLLETSMTILRLSC